MRTSATKLCKRNLSLFSRLFNDQRHVISPKYFPSRPALVVVVDDKCYSRNIYREFSTFSKQLQQQIQPVEQPVTQKWTLESLVSDVVTEEYTKENMEEFIEENLKLLKSNQIKTLKQWKALSDEDKKKYPDGLKTILDKACQIEGTGTLTHEERKEILMKLINVSSVEHLHKKPVVSNQVFESFVYREEGKRRVIETAKSNMESFEMNKTEIRGIDHRMVRKAHKFIQIIGGSGSGKTRAACEVGNTLREAAKAEKLESLIFNRTCEVYIDFFNGNAIGTTEEDRAVSNVLGLRIFVRALRTESNASYFAKAIGEKKLELLSKQGVFEFDLVMEVLSQFCHQSFKIAQSEPIPLVIILDEFQNTLTAFKDKSMLHILGTYFCNLTGLNKNLIRDQFILIPVIAGTLPSDANDQIFQPTGYGCTRYPLPMFPLSIVQKLVEEVGVPKQLFIGLEFQRFWYLMGLVPRSLEIAASAVIRLLKDYSQIPDGYNRKVFIEKLYNRVTFQLEDEYDLRFDDSTLYTSSIAEDDLLLMYCLTGVKADKNQIWLDELEEKGKIYLTEDRRLYLPYPVFKKLLSSRTWIPSDCLPILRASFSWEDLEQLDIHILAQRISLFSRLECQFVRMGDLFPGYGNSSVVDDLEVKVQKVSFANEKEFYIQVKVEEDEITKEEKKIILVDQHDKEIYIDSRSKALVGDERMKYVFCAKPNHPKTDARWFTKTKEGKPVLVLIQYKYTRINKKPKSTPIKWYESFANEISQAHPGYQIVYVYITNANIKKDAEEAIAKYPDEMIVVDGSIASQYFAPIILPYFTFVDLTDKTSSTQDE